MIDFQGSIMKWGAGTSITRLDEVSQSKQVTRNDRACVMRSLVGIVYLGEDGAIWCGVFILSTWFWGISRLFPIEHPYHQPEFPALIAISTTSSFRV